MRLLTRREAAARLGFRDYRTLDQHVQSGRLKVIRLGKITKIDESDLEAFIYGCKSGDAETRPEPNANG